MAVIGAIVVSWAIDLGSHGVATLGAVPSGLPRFGLPQVHLSAGLLMNLLPTAFSIFVVILAQSAATSRAYATRYNERFNENMDLVGLSLANIGAGLSGAFVVNGSPTASEMVDSAGGRYPIGPDHQQHHRPFGAVLPDRASGLHAGRGFIRGGFPHLCGPHRRQGDAPHLSGAALGILGGPHHRGHRGPGGREAGHPPGHVPVAG